MQETLYLEAPCNGFLPLRRFPEACRALLGQLFLISLVVWFLVPASHASDFPPGSVYQYFDNDDNRHIGSSVPPEYIKNGYIVKSAFGEVLLKVDKALTEDELAKIDNEKEAQKRLEEQQQDQAAKDKALLRSFSSAADAQRALDRKLAALNVIIDITKGSILQLESDYEQEQSVATNYERAGKTVPDELHERLNSIKEQIEEAFRFIRSKQQEKDTVQADYQKDIIRLKELIN